MFKDFLLSRLSKTHDIIDCNFSLKKSDEGSLM